MALLAVRDETTGQIKPWVWVVGAGFAIGGAALFLKGGSSSDTVAPSTSEGLGTGSGLDSLDAALQALLQNLDPGSTGGGSGSGGGSGGGGGGGGTTSGVTAGGQTVKGVPSPIYTRPAPTTGSTGTSPLPAGTINTRPIPISSGPTASTSVTGLPIGGTSTGRRTAVSTGSINVYPVSKQVNPGPPESVRRNPVAADI